MVKFNKPLHDQYNKRERYHLAESIVKVLEDQTPPTRFLKKAPHCGINSDEKWVIISKDHAIRKTLQALREKETGGEAVYEDDLLDIASGRYHDKTKFLGQDEDWNNVIQHLFPPSNPFLSSNKEECPSPSKRQKTNQCPRSISTIAMYDQTDDENHFDQDSTRKSSFSSATVPAGATHSLANEVCIDQLMNNYQFKKTIDEDECSLSAIDLISVESEVLNEQRYIDFDACVNELEQLDEDIVDWVDGRQYSHRSTEERSWIDSFCCSPVVELCSISIENQE